VADQWLVVPVELLYARLQLPTETCAPMPPWFTLFDGSPVIPKSRSACAPILQPALRRKYGAESSVQPPVPPFVSVTPRRIGAAALPVPVVL
jgi:hypothetical protein